MTLDSNVVLDALERAYQAAFPDALTLIELHPHLVTLQVATRTPHYEATRWPDALDERGIGVISSVMRWNVSRWGRDVWGGGEISEVIDRATGIIFPQGVGKGDIAQNRLRDADIVEAHRRSGATYS